MYLHKLIEGIRGRRDQAELGRTKQDQFDHIACELALSVLLAEVIHQYRDETGKWVDVDKEAAAGMAKSGFMVRALIPAIHTSHNV
ncbi:hypothetical protein C3408_22605 [Candidatus Pantoea alvi]|nr:hypothetical protein C3408_22605 [Pantoea alvi]